MPQATITAADVFEDAGPLLMARVVGSAGTAITQATCSSITLAVYDVSTGSSVATATLTISSVIFDTLQTDAIWTKDSIGYNFKYAMLAAQLPTGGATYDVEIKITPASGSVIWLKYRLTAVGVLTS